MYSQMHRRQTNPATGHGSGGPKGLSGSTRHIPKVLEPCRRIERSDKPTRPSVTLCCDQFRGRYDHCNRLGQPRNSSDRPGIDWAGLEVFARAARRDGRPISDAYGQMNI